MSLRAVRVIVTGVGIKGGMGNEEMGNVETRKWGNEEITVQKKGELGVRLIPELIHYLYSRP